MKRSTLWKIICILILLLMLAAQVFAVVAVMHMNMLPDAYMAALIGVLVLFSLAVGLMLLVEGKKPGKGRRIVACVLAVILTFGCTALGTVSLDVIQTLELTRQNTLEITTR